MSELQFKDKVVFITGAAKGQGRAVALAFAKQGAKIIGFDLAQKISYPAYNDADSSDLKKLEADVSDLGSEAATFTGDVRDAKAVQAAVEGGIKAFGKIDILFNNAGICAYGKSWELTEDEWNSMIGINLTGSWLVSKYVIPYLIKQKSGVIIYNSSVGGLRGMNRLSHYAASKHGLVGLTKSQAIELAPYGIRVLSIHPTGVDTPMNDGIAALEGKTPEEIAVASAGNLIDVPWIEPEDVADSVLFLASDHAKFVTGSQYVLDAGLLTR